MYKRQEVINEITLSDDFITLTAENSVLNFPAKYKLYLVEDYPSDIYTSLYMYTPDSGFIKIPEPTPEPSSEELIEQAYRDRIANEVSGIGY